MIRSTLAFLVLAAALLSAGCEKVTVDPSQLDLEEPYVPDLGLVPLPTPAPEENPAPSQDPNERFYRMIAEELEEGQTDKAIVNLTEYVSETHGPAAERAHYLLAVALAKGGRIPEARTQAARALALYPAGPHTAELAALLRRLKEIETAEEKTP